MYCLSHLPKVVIGMFEDESLKTAKSGLWPLRSSVYERVQYGVVGLSHVTSGLHVAC